MAQRRQVGVELAARRRPRRRDREGGSPPAFAPGKQEPGPGLAGGVALGERGQLGPMSSGLGSKLRCTECPPVLIEDLKPASASGQHPPWIARRLRPQRFAEPAADASHGQASSPAEGRRGEMTSGEVAMSQVQCDSPGEEACLGFLARAEFSQAPGGGVRGAQQLTRDCSGRVVRLDEHEPRVSLPPGAALRPEQPVGRLRPVGGNLRAVSGERAAGCRQQQLGLDGRPAMGLLDITHGGVSLGQRIAGQPGRQQYVAPVPAEFWRRQVQRPEAEPASSRSDRAAGRSPDRNAAHA